MTPGPRVFGVQITEGKRTTRKIIDCLFLIAREFPIPEPFSKYTQTTTNKRVVYNKIVFLTGNAGLRFTTMTVDEEFYSA